MGIGWTKSGQVVQGKYMNIVSHNAIGGRLEEGDYLEPWLRLHLIKKPEDPDALQVDLQTSVEMFSNGAGILGDLANGDQDNLKIFPEQAYIEARNVFTKGLTVWIGSRLYRKNDVHIADYFYFDKLVGEGVGVVYDMGKAGNLDFAILTRTGVTSFFKSDVPTGPTSSFKGAIRQTTMFNLEYKVPLGMGTSYVQGMGQFHVVPRSAIQDFQTAPAVNPPDWGAVGGLKLHLDFGGDNFNDTSIRFGNRIANGAEGGAQTYQTFGTSNIDGTYKGAYGIEFVDHFDWDIKDIVGINGYVMAHYSHGASDLEPSAGPRDPTRCSDGNPTCVNSRGDYAVGVRPTFYVTDQFHILTEATYSARKDDQNAQGTLLKLAIAPTIVPTGSSTGCAAPACAGRSSWTRPHIRFMYVFGYYNQAAQDQVMSGFLATVGPTKFAHFLGIRTEWWL